jgi:hypothetical protein
VPVYFLSETERATNVFANSRASGYLFQARLLEESCGSQVAILSINTYSLPMHLITVIILIPLAKCGFLRVCDCSPTDPDPSWVFFHKRVIHVFACKFFLALEIRDCIPHAKWIPGGICPPAREIRCESHLHAMQTEAVRGFEISGVVVQKRDEIGNDAAQLIFVTHLWKKKHEIVLSACLHWRRCTADLNHANRRPCAPSARFKSRILTSLSQHIYVSGYMSVDVSVILTQVYYKIFIEITSIP